MTSLSTDNFANLNSQFPIQGPGGSGNARPRWIPLFIGVLIVSLFLLLIADRLFHPQKFQIKDIEVHGQFDQVEGNDVKQIVEAAIEGNYFSLNLGRLENEIIQIPWVFSASLRRKWPSTIVVDVVEVQPVARWGESQWLNFSGDLVNREEVKSGISDVSDYSNLPILFGAEYERQVVWKAFQDWSVRFASNGLVLNQLSLDSRDLWHLTLSLSVLARNGDQSHRRPNQTSSPTQVSMVVERGNAHTHIWRFVDAFNQELINRFAEMKSIDLRYPNGFAISWQQDNSVAQTLTESSSE